MGRVLNFIILRAIYEAAAQSVRKDSRLVAWYAVRGDIWKAVLLVIGAILLFGWGMLLAIARELQLWRDAQWERRE